MLISSSKKDYNLNKFSLTSAAVTVLALGAVRIANLSNYLHIKGELFTWELLLTVLFFFFFFGHLLQ